MKQELGEPIIIFEDDFDGEYMVIPKKPFKKPSNALGAIVMIGVGLLVLLLAIALGSRVLKKLFL